MVLKASQFLQAEGEGGEKAQETLCSQKRLCPGRQEAECDAPEGFEVSNPERKSQDV
jgi:hypothetical protein